MGEKLSRRGQARRRMTIEIADADRTNTLPPLPVTIYNIIHLLPPLCSQSQEIWYTSAGEGHGYLAWCEVEVEVKVTPELL